MEVAMDTHAVDKGEMLKICAGRMACAVVMHLLDMISCHIIRQPLTSRILRWYDVRLFQARARLDLPTYGFTNVQRQLDDASSINLGRSVAYQTLQTAVSVVKTIAQMVAQAIILGRVLGRQRDGTLPATLAISSQVVHWMSVYRVLEPSRGELD